MENVTGAPVSETLAVPGARLHIERRGTGPVLLCIPGGSGDAEVFGAIARLLAGHFTVVAYDRRGFSRSALDSPAIDDAMRLAVDADDAARVIAHCGGAAHVLGSSSGAIVGLDLLARHPARVRTLIAHEPPLMTLLADGGQWLARFDDVHATFVASGVEPAMAKFNAAVGLPAIPTPPPGAQLPPHVAALLVRLVANQAFWLAHELLPYPRFVPDLARLRADASALVLAVGREPRDGILAQPARALAAALDLPVREFTGGHIGYTTDPVAFARELGEVLRS